MHSAMTNIRFVKFAPVRDPFRNTLGTRPCTVYRQQREML